MKKLTFSFMFINALLLQPASAQEMDLSELQDNIEIFSGVLEDALDLNRNSGLFGISVGGVNATYLYEQGVLIEVRTPLANQRNRLSLATLNSAMQSMQANGNPFERMARRTSPTATQTPNVNNENTEDANGLDQGLMDRIAKVDYSLVVSNAIQQASDSARALRALGNVDEANYESLRSEFDSMRAQLQENVDRLSQVEQEIQSTDTTSDASEFSVRIDALIAQLEPLRAQAIERAEELKQQTELAESRYAERWHEDVMEFEQNLYAAMCNYGATLRALPDNEYISIILKGLGEDSANTNRRPDKVHVLNKSDVQLCQSGEIDVASLRNRSAHYSY